MRRFISIAMVLLFWLGPLSALAPGSDDSQLPACCRRHGAHHCAMSTDVGSVAAHVFTAPAHCPQYNRALPAAVTVFTLPEISVAALATETRLTIVSIQSEALHQTRTASTRGPPAIL